MSTASKTHATGKINVTTYEPQPYEEIYDLPPHFTADAASE